MGFQFKSGLLTAGLISAFASIAIPAQVQPAAELVVDPCEVADYESIDIFDPDLAADAKKATLVKVEAGVAAGCGYDAYVLGTLLRHGPSLPGNVVTQDPARAELLIESYARSGYVSAYADLAEMALAQNDARSAMKWTQVYLYFKPESVGDIPRDFDRRGYNADLLARAYAAWRKSPLDNREINKLLNDYLSAHRATVLAGAVAKAKWGKQKPGRIKDGSTEAPVLVPKPYPQIVNVGRLKIAPGYANFLLEVQPDGHVSRIVAETFGPSADTPAALKPLIAGVSFEAFNASEPQVARIPVVYGYAQGGPTIKKKPSRPSK